MYVVYTLKKQKTLLTQRFMPRSEFPIGETIARSSELPSLTVELFVNSDLGFRMIYPPVS